MGQGNARRCGKNPHVPPIVTIGLDDAVNDESLLDRCGVAWVVLDQPRVAGLYSLMSILQERHIAGMVTRPEETAELGGPFQEGAVVVPPETQPAAACAILRTLWSQAGVVRALRGEIHALHMHHGGLCDQMDKIDEELRLAAQLQREFLPSRCRTSGRSSSRSSFAPPATSAATSTT